MALDDFVYDLSSSQLVTLEAQVASAGSAVSAAAAKLRLLRETQRMVMHDHAAGLHATLLGVSAAVSGALPGAGSTSDALVKLQVLIPELIRAIGLAAQPQPLTEDDWAAVDGAITTARDSLLKIRTGVVELEVRRSLLDARSRIVDEAVRAWAEDAQMGADTARADAEVTAWVRLLDDLSTHEAALDAVTASSKRYRDAIRDRGLALREDMLATLDALRTRVEAMVARRTSRAAVSGHELAGPADELDAVREIGVLAEQVTRWQKEARALGDDPAVMVARIRDAMLSLLQPIDVIVAQRQAIYAGTRYLQAANRLTPGRGVLDDSALLAEMKAYDRVVTADDDAAADRLRDLCSSAAEMLESPPSANPVDAEPRGGEDSAGELRAFLAAGLQLLGGTPVPVAQPAHSEESAAFAAPNSQELAGAAADLSRCVAELVTSVLGVREAGALATLEAQRAEELLGAGTLPSEAGLRLFAEAFPPASAGEEPPAADAPVGSVTGRVRQAFDVVEKRRLAVLASFEALDRVVSGDEMGGDGPAQHSHLRSAAMVWAAIATHECDVASVAATRAVERVSETARLLGERPASVLLRPPHRRRFRGGSGVPARASLSSRPSRGGRSRDPMRGHRIMAVHAHPDDANEGTGAALISAAQRGLATAVLTMTTGDLGIPDDAELRRTVLNAQGEPDRAALARVRAIELMRANDALGVSWRRQLSYGDSGMPGTEDNEREGCLWQAWGTTAGKGAILDAMVRAIREFRPDVVTTYGEDGGYGHPDHLVAHQATLEAIEAAADPTYQFSTPDAHPRPGHQRPHQVQKLYYQRMPRSVAQMARDQAMEQGIDLSKIPMANVYFMETTSVDDNLVTTRVGAPTLVAAKQDALRKHETQMRNVNWPLLWEPEKYPWVAELVGYEYFQLVKVWDPAKGRWAAPPAGHSMRRPETDLAAGLPTLREARTERRSRSAQRREFPSAPREHGL